ncbi:MBL fold metallo-hydrolase, partial [Escherichia coli]|uniref:MBL fold metallo-hydrolase n=1 Tax=Escherichia coli TaxID=562 RepID=UPI0011749044
FQPVPLRLKQLPPLDAVVISHDHYDHLDIGTVRELRKLQTVPFITSLGVGAHLQAWGVPPERIVELDW